MVVTITEGVLLSVVVLAVLAVVACALYCKDIDPVRSKEID